MLLKQNPTNAPALSVAGGLWDDLRRELTQLSQQGMPRLTMMARLHNKVRSLDMDADQFNTYSAVWGRFVERCTTWPLDDASFIDYFVGTLAKKHAKVKNKNKKEE
tara:strand:- start:151 stop:468 length:318 start_codon:yes stop_codon:yes gene_type:complete